MIVVGARDDWIPRGRFEFFTVTEATGHRGSFDESFFTGLPALLLPEIGLTGADQTARVGEITSITSTNQGITFKFKQSEKIVPIPSYLVVEHASELGIDPDGGQGSYRPWELHRTHWAVKDVDLCEVLCGVLGGESLGIIGVVAGFETILQEQNECMARTLGRAREDVRRAPADAVLRANAALEGIVKTIAEDERVGMPNTGNCSSTKLVKDLVDRLGLAAGDFSPKEVKTIAGSLRSLADAVNSLRSDNTDAHGKMEGDYLIDDPLWAELVINSTATLGLFLWRYYRLKVPPLEVGADWAFEGVTGRGGTERAEVGCC